MRDKLDDLLSILSGLERPVAKLLFPGLSQETVIGAFRAVGLATSAEIVTLYTWRNGTNLKEGYTLDDLHLFPGFYFSSLEEAMLNYQTFRRDRRWKKEWVPLFANGGGDFYAVDLSQSNGRTAPVVGFMLGEDDHPVEYESLGAMISTFVDCFRQGAFFVRDGYLDVDDSKQAKIAALNNPTNSFWKEEH